MANNINLANITPRILAQALVGLQANTVTTRLVSSDYQSDAAKRGSTIEVPIVQPLAVNDVVPANVAPDSQGVEVRNVSIALDQWKEVPFEFTEKELFEIENGLPSSAIEQAAINLAEYVDAYVLSLYTQIYNYTGTAGTTPFTAGTPADALQMNKILNENKAPVNGRYALVDPAAEASALMVRAFQDAAWNQTTEGVNDARISRKFGFNWWQNQQMPLHTTGTATGYTVTGAHAVGATTINIGAGSNGFNVGDLITFAGQTQSYTVLAATGGPPNTSITIGPQLGTALAGGEAISSVASHRVNLGFHPKGIAFVSRPLQEASMIPGGIEETVTDPISGLSLRLTGTKQHHRDRWALSVLFGAAVVRPELCVRLIG